MIDHVLPSESVADLLRACAAADPAAFRTLYDLRSAKLYAVALRITRQPALAADAVHDAFLQVWRNASRYDPARGNADAWLLGLVRYRALDIAARSRREVLGAEMPDPADDAPDPLARLTATRDGARLHACLEEVEPDRRRLVVMAFVDGLTHAEVAARCRQPLGTVKSSIRRALIALRGCLGRAGETGS